MVQFKDILYQQMKNIGVHISLHKPKCAHTHTHTLRNAVCVVSGS